MLKTSSRATSKLPPGRAAVGACKLTPGGLLCLVRHYPDGPL